MASLPINQLVDLLTLYRRPTEMVSAGFDAQNPLWNSIRILVVGAGGLGCELLHSLALSGFTDLAVVDMDTIELSNLNRQFLFREKDIGKPKANVAAEFVMKRCPHVKIEAHFCRIEEKGDDFYRSFHMILLGLDSVYARRWMNAKVSAIAERDVDEDGQYRITEATPLIDGGTEGYSGSVKTVLMGKTACVECTMWMYPPTKAVPMCTLENVPRIPEHCVLYIKEKLWKDLRPDEELDADIPEHIVWVAERAQERQRQFNIRGSIDYAFTLGVVKNVVPAVGFTNAIVAGCTVLEALKVATAIAQPLNSYAYYNGSADGVTSTTQFLAPSDDCPLCSATCVYTASFDVTPAHFLSHFVAKLPMNEIWKLQPCDNEDDSVSPMDGNPNAALKVYIDGHGAQPVYLKYSTDNPLRLSDTIVLGNKTIRSIIQAKRAGISQEKGFVFEATNNGLAIRIFVKDA
jgi:NEDD8-activating enzyme E1